jgi:hypothetical protein
LSLSDVLGRGWASAATGGDGRRASSGGIFVDDARADTPASGGPSLSSPDSFLTHTSSSSPSSSSPRSLCRSSSRTPKGIPKKEDVSHYRQAKNRMALSPRVAVAAMRMMAGRAFGE